MTTATSDRITLRFPLEPVPASRPRVTRWGTYHTKRYKDWLEGAALALPLISAAKNPYFPKDAHLKVTIEVVCTKAKTSKLTRPRGDLDNYEKAVLDVITHARTIWDDDVQVTRLQSHKRFAATDESAHTKVIIERVS